MAEKATFILKKCLQEKKKKKCLQSEHFFANPKKVAKQKPVVKTVYLVSIPSPKETHLTPWKESPSLLGQAGLSHRKQLWNSPSIHLGCPTCPVKRRGFLPILISTGLDRAALCLAEYWLPRDRCSFCSSLPATLQCLQQSSQD